MALSSVQRTMLGMLAILVAGAIAWCVVLLYLGDTAEARYFARASGSVIGMTVMLGLIFRW